MLEISEVIQGVLELRECVCSVGEMVLICENQSATTKTCSSTIWLQ